MPLVAPDPIFQGITPAGTRKALGYFLGDFGDEVDIYLQPCVGQFTVSEALVKFGVTPDRLFNSDITLFSSTLGYLCDPSHSVASLNFMIESEKLWDLVKTAPINGEAELAIAVRTMYAIKWAQLHGKSEFVKWQRIQFEQDAKKILKQFTEALTEFRDRLLGSRYEIRDILEHTNEHLHDERCMIWYDPPWYSGGYTKMFDSHGIYSWKEPDIPELDLKKSMQFFDTLLQAKARVLVHIRDVALDTWDFGGWHRIYADYNNSTMDATFLLSNRPVKKTLMTRQRFKTLPVKIFSIMMDEEITEESEVGFKRLTYEQAMYYYDLFCRNLGMTNAESFFAFLIDGKVAGVVGIHWSAWKQDRKTIFSDVFSLTSTHTRYRRLGSLMTGLLCTREVAEFMLNSSFKHAQTTGPALKSYRTTFLSKHPAIMKVRGLMKLILREPPNNKHPNLYRLQYETKLRDESMKDMLCGWLGKDGKKVTES